MKIFINCSTLKKGGALQVGLSFLNEIKNNSKHKYSVVISKSIQEQLNLNEFSNSFKFYQYTIIPSLKR